ncbi:hypothetical protein DPMN_019999 [Dreissena polymorpha]|uniref:Uncharacterized protein n=1 Tax=Dreissena polymorpha TaxID=45954 RepID=A0A9D4SAN8_DREPO|nr:hypothetical protein DPMN_019999 [Dreissena polymorpha]
MLFSNNVNRRPGEQYAIDAIQQQLLLAVLEFGWQLRRRDSLHLCLWQSRSSSSNKNNKNSFVGRSLSSQGEAQRMMLTNSDSATKSQ